MVLEHLFPEDWLEKRAFYAFLIAVIYSNVGILVARLLFGANSGIVSVFIASILIMPYLSKLFESQRVKTGREAGFRVKNLLADNKGAIKVYLAIFLGIYLTYALMANILPMIGHSPTVFFKEQLLLDSSIKGKAFSIATFEKLIVYNWWVLVACFALALVAGDGAVFLIAWNASSWGSILGFRAFSAGAASGTEPLLMLLLVVAVTLPHLLLEGLSYILAAISGSVLSKEIVERSEEIRKFVIHLVRGSVLFLIFYLFSVYYGIKGYWFLFLSVIAVFSWLRFMGNMFNNARRRSVFSYNYKLLALAALVLLVAVVVETIVLSNSSILKSVYSLAAAR